MNSPEKLPQELLVIVDEWEKVGDGTKTVPLIQTAQLSPKELEKERKIFKYVANTIKKLLKKND